MIFVYAAKRVLLAVPLLLGVVVVNFLLIHLTPGDPATILVGDYPAPPEYVAQVRQEFGLDQPLWLQLLLYLRQLLSGNLGYSFANRLPVAELIAQRVGATLELTVAAMALACVFGCLLGIVAARRRGQATDTAAQVVSLAGFSLPEFWLGQLLILAFALGLGWLPSQGNSSLRDTSTGILSGARYLILPATALSFRYLALIARLARASLLEVLGADFILASRARGAPERVILRRAFKNAAAPVITVIGYNVGFLLAGSALVETVFAWPGIGRLLFDSISKRDYPVLTALLLLISASVVVANLLTDLIHAWIDPRVRLA